MDRVKFLKIFDCCDNEELERMIKMNELFNIVHPPTYDEFKNCHERYYLNGKPMIFQEKVLSLAELRTKARERGLKGYHRMRKEKLQKLLNKC